MNKIITYIFLGFMALVGGGSTLYLIIALIGMILYKLYRKIRYGAKWSD